MADRAMPTGTIFWPAGPSNPAGARVRFASLKPAVEVRKENRLMLRRLVRSMKGDEGQGLAEYALILALIAVVAIVSLVFLGTAVSTLLSMIGHSVQTAT